MIFAVARISSNSDGKREDEEAQQKTRERQKEDQMKSKENNKIRKQRENGTRRTRSILRHPPPDHPTLAEHMPILNSINRLLSVCLSGFVDPQVSRRGLWARVLLWVTKGSGDWTCPEPGVSNPASNDFFED